VLNKIKPEFLKSLRYIFDFIDEQKKFMEQLANKYLNKMTVYKAKNYICINNSIYKKLPSALQKCVIKTILKELNYPSKPNRNMLDLLTRRKKRYLYKSKSFYSISRNQYFWFIDKRGNFGLFQKQIPITRIPFSLQNGSIKIKLTKKKIFNPKKVFSFNSKKSIFPITIRNLNKNDAIFINKKNRKKITSIMKDNKIPVILFDEVIVLEDCSGQIIGFMFSDYFRISHNFYVNEMESENVVLEVKDDR